MKRLLATAALVLLSGCSTPPPSTPPDETAVVALTSASARDHVPPASAVPRTPAEGTALLFCAFGGQGVIPIGVDPLDVYWGVAVLGLAKSERARTIEITRLELVGQGGKLVAESKNLDGVGLLPAAPGSKWMRDPGVEPAPPPNWSSFMDPKASPFSGPIEPDHEAALKATFKLVRGPTVPVERCRLSFTIDGEAREADAPSNGEWPSG